MPTFRALTDYTDGTPGATDRLLFETSGNLPRGVAPGSLPVAVASGANGLMTGADKAKLDGVATSAIANLVEDTTPQLGGNLDGQGNTIHNFEAEINTQTDTTYTTVDADRGKIISLNNAGPVTLTVHQAATVGFSCLLYQKGAGQVTVAAGGTGSVLNRQSHTKIAGQHGVASVWVESNAGTAPQVVFGGDTAA